MESMKVHHFTRGGFWEREPSLTLGCKRLRPLAPKLSNNDNPTSPPLAAAPFDFDLKSFIKPESASRKLASSEDNKKDPPNSPQSQVETQQGGTRWNPTQEQIGILEMLYRGGTRTPNAEQIEQITVQLGNYGKIEGKNVFYWFQNHKARDRQKQKKKRRNTSTLALAHTPPVPTITKRQGEVVERDDKDSPLKKYCRSWEFEYLDEPSWASISKDVEHETLELFPLHPEGCRLRGFSEEILACVSKS